MSATFAFLSANPAYLAGVVLLLVLGAWSLFKKLIKMTVITAILFFGYCYYLNGQGQALPTAADAERVLQQGKTMTSQLEKKAQSVEQQAQQAAKEAAQVKAKVDALQPKAGAK